MRTVIWLALVAGFLPPAAWPQDALKIGVVDVQRVMAESRVGKQMREKFRSEVTKTETELRQEKQELERQFQRRYRDYVRVVQDAQEDLREREAFIAGKRYSRATIGSGALPASAESFAIGHASSRACDGQTGGARAGARRAADAEVSDARTATAGKGARSGRRESMGPGAFITARR
ncbi:MAG: OmpH family outer membrane protein [Acidobacteria bacterium]|nr:OmpH family outer membrane protein [Acidobacteriota bacterium]